MLELGKIKKKNALKFFYSLDQHEEEDIQTDLKQIKFLSMKK